MLHRHVHGIALAGFQRLWMLVAFAMRQVEEPVADPRRGAVGGHVHQPQRHLRHRLVDGDGQCQHRVAHHVQGLGQGGGVEDQAAGIVTPLIAGLVAGMRVGTPLAAMPPDPERRVDLAHTARKIARCGERAIRAKRKRGARDVRRGPGGLGDPVPVTARIMRRRAGVILQEEAQRRLVHDAGIDALQPLVPPAGFFGQPVDGRAGFADMWILVRPRPDDALGRAGQILDQPEHGSAIAVGPAADGVDGDLDIRIILADRAVLPEGVAGLMLQPVLQPQPRISQTRQPHLAPAVADMNGVGRQGVDAEHHRCPGQLLAQEGATHVVDVVGIAVIGGADRHHRLQRGRLKRGQLQAVEPAPGNADDAHAAIAPRLIRDPGDHVAAVLQLDLGVLIGHDAFGFAGAAQIDTDIGVSPGGKPRCAGVIAFQRLVVLAVGNVFEDRGHRRRLRPLGHPDPRRQECPVWHGDLGMLDLADRGRQRVVDFQIEGHWCGSGL